MSKKHILLLFSLFVSSVSTARIAVFIELNLSLNKLFVLATPVIDALTFLAREFYKLIL